AAYWRQQLRSPVQFGTGLQTVLEHGCHIVVEVGPTPTLLGLGPQMAGGERAAWLPTLRGERQGGGTPLGTPGEVYRRGVPIDWRGVDADYTRKKVALPTYPFQRQRYWVDAKPVAQASTPTVDRWREWLYDVAWEKQAPSDAAATGSIDGHWIVFADDA